jgi:hypothetical protein
MSKASVPELPIDPALRGRANVTQDELRTLGRICREFRVSETTSFVLARMASYPPHIRLAVNLKTLIGLLTQAENPKYNVLKDGLMSDEYAALVELDMRGLPSHAREIAHGLFNVHERWFLMKQLRRLFRGAYEARDEYISPKEDNAADS